jgi:cation-transporting ATPase 13A2
MGESVPNASSVFSHRRSRRDSTTSFAYLEDDQDHDDGDSASGDWSDEDALLDVEEQDENNDSERRSLDPENTFMEPDMEEDDDLERGSQRVSRRRLSSGVSRSSRMTKSSRGSASPGRRSVDRPLLKRNTSAGSDASGYRSGGRTNQKIYIHAEDMTIVVAGFKTSMIGFALYVCVCVLTGGLGYLVFRWLPKWYVRFTGKPAPIGTCDWVVVENQWGEMAVQDLKRLEFGNSMSTVFGQGGKGKMQDFDEYDDPIMDELRILDYRYLRFCYHPVKDKLVPGNTWQDPAWTDVTAVRAGIDSDEQENRERIFGRNVIDIEQKTTGQLLMDEAFHPFYVFQIASLFLWSVDEYYYYAACILLISVISITTTLIETKATMKRLREISRFDCDIRVLRSGFWRYVDWRPCAWRCVRSHRP